MEELFNLSEGIHINRNYKVLKFLGNGWEGEVYKVEEQQTGIIRATKLFYDKKNFEKARHIKYALKLHKLRSCPIIIQYHHKDSAYIKGKRVDFVVSDYVDGEVLSDYLNRHKKKRIPIFEALHIFYALVFGIEHIHFIGEYHGDIHSDNIIIKRSGLGFDVKLIDILHLGRTTRDKIQEDIYDLIGILYEMIGGIKTYKKCPANLKKIILGRKKSLIRDKFKMAGHLRLFLDNLSW